MSLIWADSGGSTVTTGVVNTPYTGTFTFLDNDVRALYVDWDDGVSNKKEEANYQWGVYTDNPTSVTLSHTYTASGVFSPVVQTVNSEGIASRYYGAEGANTDLIPYSRNIAIGAITVSDTTPTAIMRVENTTVNSGIDNSILEREGPQQVFIAIAPTLTGPELTGTIKEIQVSVEGVVHRNKYNAVSGEESQLVLGTDVSQETTVATIDFTASVANRTGIYDFFKVANNTENGAYSKILKVSFDSCKAVSGSSAYENVGTDYTKNEIFNRLKIFLVTKASDGKYYPITYVSAGSPIKTVDSNLRYSTLDMGQSRAAASNISISNYRYDNGKMWFSPVEQWSLSTNILGTGSGFNRTKQTSSVKPVHYSYLVNPYGLNTIAAAQEVFASGTAYTWYKNASTAADAIREDSIALDDFGRIYDQYHMVRNSVEAASTSGSIITTNQPEVFWMHPTPNWTTPDAATVTSTLDYTTQMQNNGSGSVMKIANLNATVQKDLFDQLVTNQEKEYLILAFDSKTSKIFINATNYANTLMSALSGFDGTSGLKIAGVEYLHVDDLSTKHQNAYWKPVEFNDTTKITREYRDTTELEYFSRSTSLARSGYIYFDMPSDWDAISMKKLCGGVYNTASGSFSACVAAGADDVTVTGSVGTAAGTSSGYGQHIPITLAAAADKTAMATIGDSDDVGAYKYAFIITTGTASGSMFWVASGTNSGWDPDAGSQGTLFIQGGTGTSAVNANYEYPAGTITGSLRRINIYDVMNGANKVFNDSGVETVVADTRLISVGGDKYNAGTSWFKNLYNASDANITGSSWATNDKYLIKLTLSGATNAGTANNPCPEVWNIFDAMQGDSTIIKETDDSAYSLNSLAVTSSVSVGRKGNYFRAITRKGKVFITKTGVGMEQIGFSSVALGDEYSSSAFADHGPSTLYGHLHMIRNLEAEGAPVYWDEQQKDGTFVRLWGVVTDVSETRGTGGPRAILNYTFNMVVKEIALIKNNGLLFTDIYPLGGIPDERTYS
jgi:hypothetical protein